jgi:hypothetical protein
MAGFLSGLELVDPGLVLARGWRGGMPDAHPETGIDRFLLGTIARKR